MTVDATSDTDLAVRAQAGERQAFDLLIRRHKVPLYRFVRRYIGNDDDAYDVLQNAFVSAWMALPRFDTQKSFATWLRAIALNKCRDFGRRQAVRRRLLRLFAFEQPNHQPVDQPEGSRGDAPEAESERLKRLDKAIAALPAFYKEPLLLTTIGGLSQQQAAVELHTTAKAVEMRIRRAKKKLTAALSDVKVEG